MGWVLRLIRIMRIFNNSTEIRINGNYGTYPNSSSIWFAGAGRGVGSYQWLEQAYINMSASIPTTHIGIFVHAAIGARANPGQYFYAYSQWTAQYGYGVNAGGTSLSPNNQNGQIFTSNGEAYAGQPIGVLHDGGNRRFILRSLGYDYSHHVHYYIRVVSKDINYMTISWIP